MNIDELPDHPAILEIASALWNTGEIRGAAVMVGAGFSRFADFAAADTALPPLWSDFQKAMAKALYPFDPGAAPANPLRLAEEFRATRGTVALDALVRSLVRDTQWQPGLLHRQLLRLPWSDILTTNWDTLIERTVDPDSPRTYEPVRTSGDIARTRAPRIVKLHGTFPSLEPFIFTEEDYRTYPRDFSAFVNLAQQILLENELCLLGFSGDDPNFLAWSGWVRDNLGPAARRIHLVGALDIAPSQRRMLEQRNVSVIDLAPLVAGHDPADRHRVAAKMFLDALQAARPSPAWRWERNDRISHADGDKEPLEALVARWRQDRERYPGWLVAPYIDRYRVRMETDQHLRRIVRALEGLDDKVLHPLLRELCWRLRISLFELPDELLEAAEKAACGSCLTAAERLEIAMVLALRYREDRNREAFERVIAIAEAATPQPDALAAVAFEHCCWARDNLDYISLEKHVEAVRGDDPAWGFRRAQMLCHLGRSREAGAAIRQASAEIKMRRLRDRSSLWLLSREAWARLMVQGAWLDDPLSEDGNDEWPAIYIEARCDPWTELQHLRSETGDEKSRRRTQRQTVPMYDPGYVKLASGEPHFARFSLTPWAELTRFVDAVGIAEFPNHTVFGSTLERAAKLLPEDDPSTIWACVLAIRSYEGFIDECFGRIQVAQLDLDFVRDLTRRLKDTIDFGRSRLYNRGTEVRETREFTVWVEECRHRLELLSRLVVRLNPAEAADYARWGFELCHDKDWDHWWLFKATSHLLERSFSALPPADQATFAEQILDLPLCSERQHKGIEQDWPELGEKLIGVAKHVVRPARTWDIRVAQLIQRARSAGRLDRTRALIRLLALVRANLLSDHEAALLASAIWAVPPTTSRLPGGSELLPFVWLELSDDVSVRDAFRADVVGRLVAGNVIEADVQALAYIEAHEGFSPEVRLSADDALAIARKLIEWRPHRGDEDNHLAPRIGICLSEGVLSRVDPDAFNEAFCRSLLDGAHEDANPYLARALPFVAIRRPEFFEEVQRTVRRAMISRERLVAEQALYAVRVWGKLATGGVSLPAVLASDVVGLCGTRYDASLLAAIRVATDLLLQGHLTDSDIERLEETLDLMLVETAYNNQTGGRLSPETLTLVRAAAAALAAHLNRHGNQRQAVRSWIEMAAEDAMPEVRFALMLDEDEIGPADKG